MRVLILLLLLLGTVAGCAQLPRVPARDEAPVKVWLPEGRSRAQVIALHGFNDHKAAFDELGAFLARSEIALTAYDHPGFGERDGRGLWPGTDRLVAGLFEQIRAARIARPDVPLFVLGDSMGGAVATVALARADAPPVDGIILVAPAVWGGSTLNPLYRVVLSVVDTFFPGLELTGRRLDILASDNLEALRALGRDPLYIKRTRVDAIAGLVALMDQARQSAPALKGDMLLLIGERDEVVPPRSQESFAALIGSRSCLKIHYPNGWHMLLRDLQRATVWQDIEAWIATKEPPSAAAQQCKVRSNFLS